MGSSDGGVPLGRLGDRPPPRQVPLSPDDPVLAWLQLTTHLAPLREAYERERATLKLASARGLSVDPNELQLALDAWRKARGLEGTAACEEWLSERGLTPEALEEHATAALLRDALQRSLTGEELCAYAKAQDGDLDVARISLIEAPTPAAARAVLDRLDQGETFEGLARSESTDAGSGAEGGSLGWTMRRDVPAPLVGPLWDSELGGTSGPVAHQGRWYVLRRDEGPLSPPPHMLEPLRAEVAAHLIEQAR